jgi:hypothetical protein
MEIHNQTESEITMLENQENNPETTAVELTVEQKLEQIVCMPRNLLEVSDVTVKPILDVLGLEVKGVGWYSGPTAEEVTIRQELVKLNKLVVETAESLTNRRDEVRTLENRVGELEEYLDENWDNIDEDLREKLCEIFRIDQEVTKTVNVTITGSLDITAPRGYDWDFIENDIEIDGSVSITNSDLDTSGYGFSVDGTEVEVD